VTVLGADELRGALAARPGWRAADGAIEKVFEFVSFPDAVAFVVRVGFAAEAANHHPDLDVRYRHVRVVLTTHDAGGVTDRDLQLADRIDALAGG